MATSGKWNNNLKGKLGRTVTYPLNGQSVTREIGIITKAPSIKQLVVRQRTKIVTDFLRPVQDFLEVGFDLPTKNTLLSPYNLATSVNRLQAIVGDYPNQEVDFAKAILSQGKIPVDQLVKVEATAIGFEFSWDPDFIIPGMDANDHVMLVAYCPEKKGAFYQLDGAKRKVGFEQISIPRYRETIVVHTYVTFIASNRKSISNSLYTGKFLW